MAGLYIDATSGGMALQIVLSGLVGGIVVVKLFWHNLIGALFFWKRRSADVVAEAVASDSEPSTS